MRKRVSKFLLPVLAVGMLAFAVLHVVKAQQQPPKPLPPVEPARTPFGHTVAGAGIIEARSQNIAVGSALPGVVQEVYAPEQKLSLPYLDTNLRSLASNDVRIPLKPGMMPWEALIGETVRAGQPLFRVDDRQLNALLAFHEANLNSARAQLAKLEAMPRPEELAVTQAKKEVARASAELMRDLAERDAKLIGSGSVSEEEYRTRRMNYVVSQRQLKQAEADLVLTRSGAWEADKEIARAAIRIAEAQVLQDKTDIERAIVRAPVDGVVLQVNVRPGEFVGANPGQALVVLGAITDHVNVRVDIDEHDIPRFKTGAPAVASLRGAPETKYPLKFVRIEPYVIPKRSLTGDNTERVDTRVMQAIYALKTEGKPFYVGQQLDVFIDVSSPKVEYPVAPPESLAKSH
jgi:multidrug resistance efflux pump